MLCTLKSALVFLYVCIAYGFGAAVVTKGLLHWSPLGIIAFRMVFGLAVCILIAIYIVSTNISIRMNFKENIYPKFEDLMHMFGQGLVYQSFPHISMAIAQLWVPSTASQIMQPIAAMVGAVVSHFLFEDERFNIYKGVALILAFSGVGCTVVPSFDHPAPSFGFFKVILGYILLFIAVACFGLGSIYMKLKPSSYHPAVTSTYQLLGATIFCVVVALINDGPKSLYIQAKTANLIEWSWPIIVGIFCSGLAVHAALYLVTHVGAIGVYFIEIGQVSFGVVVGVVWLHEWDHYNKFDVLISLGGIALIGIGVVIGFIEPKHQEYEPIP